MNSNSNVIELERRLAERGSVEQLGQRRELPVFLSVPEAATVLRVSPGLIYQLIRDGEFPAMRMGQKKYAIPVQAIEMIIDVIVASGTLIGVADWKEAWRQRVASRSVGVAA